MNLPRWFLLVALPLVIIILFLVTMRLSGCHANVDWDHDSHTVPAHTK